MKIHLVFVLLGIFSFLKSANASEIGCFNEEYGLRREIYVPATTTTNMSVAVCRSDCVNAGYNYASVSLGKYCFCGDGYGGYNSALPWLCTATCPADGLNCGGTSVDGLTMSVYSVSQPIKDVEIHVLGVVSANTPVSIVVNNTANMTATYNVTFSDNSTMVSISDSQGPATIQHIFATVGHVSISALAIDSDDNTASTTTMVYVQEPVWNTSIACPAAVELTKEFQCNITILRGSNMDGKVDLADGKQKTFKFPDSEIEKVGLLINAPKSSEGQTANVIYMLQHSIISSNGFLTGWEFDAIDTGTIQLQVYRPKCRAGYEFCYTSYSCLAEGQECAKQDPVWALTCTAAQRFTFSGMGCVDKTNKNKIRKLVFEAWNSIPVTTSDNFVLVGETEVSVTETGLQFKYLQELEHIEVKAGDMLALHQVSKAIIGITSSSVNSEHHSPQGGNWAGRDPASQNFSPPGGFTAVNYIHLIRAHVQTSVAATITHNYTAEAGPGVKRVILDVNNLVAAAAGEDAHMETTSTTIDVQEAITDVEFQAPVPEPTFGEVTFVILDHPGTNVTYEFEFGDGGANTTYETPTITHVYTEAGVYNVTVFCSNNISEYSAFTTVIIQDTIMGLNITAAQIATILTQPSRVDFEIQQGTNVSYELHFDDGKDYTLPHDAEIPADTVGDNQGYYGWLEHVLPDVGNWTVQLVCSNKVSQQTVVEYLPVQIQVIDIYLECPAPVLYMEEYAIEVNTTNGTEIEWASTFDGNKTRNFTMGQMLYKWEEEVEVACPTQALEITTASTSSSFGDNSTNNSNEPIQSTSTPSPLSTLSRRKRALPDNVTVTYEPNNATTPTTAPPICYQTIYHSDPVGHSQDGFIHITPEDYHNQVGSYELTVSAWNLVTPSRTLNCTFWVDYGIEDLQVVYSEIYVPPHRNVTWELTVTRASRVDLYLDYDDGNTLEEYHQEILNGTVLNYTHSFDDHMNVTVNFTLVNPVDIAANLTHVIVQREIKNYTFTTNSPVACWPNGTCDAIFTIDLDDGAIQPTDPFYEYTFGDGTEKNSTYMNITDLETEVNIQRYPDIGDYPVTLNISNYVNYQYFTTVVTVEQPVLNLTITAEPQAVVINTICRLTVKAPYGTRFNVTWKFADNQPDETAPFDENITTRDFINYKDHNYTDGGVFYVQAWAYNSLGNFIFVIEKPVIVQQKVTGFMLSGTKQSLVDAPSWEVTVDFHLYHMSTEPLPTNASYYIDFDDGTTSHNYSLVANPNANLSDGVYDHFLSFNHTYYRGKAYQVKIAIFNFASEKFYLFTADVYEKIFGLSMIAKSSKPAADGSTELINGTGPNHNFFPLGNGYSVYFNTSYEMGSHVTYHWNFGDGISQTVQTTDISYEYQEAGTYNVTLNASNPLNWVIIWKSVTVQNVPVEGEIKFFVDEPSPRNTTFIMQIYPGSGIPSDACYLLDLKDPTAEPSRYYFLGEQSECIRTYENTLEWADSTAVKNQFTAENLTAIRDPTQPREDFHFDIQVKYMTNGVFNTALRVSNQVNTVVYTKNVGVTRGFCKWPNVSLSVFNTCQEPFCDENNNKTHYRSKELVISADIAIKCDSTRTYHHTWEVSRVNEETGELTPLTSEELGGVSLYSQSLYDKLKIARRVLSYGFYRVDLNVSMDGEIGIENQTYAYFRIIKTPLEGHFVGGFMARKKFMTNITIDVITDSYDPDVEKTDKSGMTFLWLCRRLCETWSTYDTNYTTLLEESVSNCTHEPLADLGGCFKYDMIEHSGVISNFTTGEHTNGTTIIDTTNWYELQVVELLVIIKKDDRVTTAKQFINITLGDPPELSSVCKANCQSKINPSIPISFQTIIVSGGRASYEYWWEIKYGAVGVVSYEALELLNATIWTPYAASTGRNTSAIYMEENLFTGPDDVNREYYFVVRAWRSGTPDNYAEYVIQRLINKPPLEGNCTVSPSNGTALKAKYNVQCHQDFEDPDLPLSYRIGWKYSSYTKVTWIYKGSSPTMTKDVYLPQGPMADGYMIDVVVEATDVIGGSVQHIAKTMSYPPTLETLEALTANMTGPEGYLKTVLANLPVIEMVQTLQPLFQYYQQNPNYTLEDADLLKDLNETNFKLSEFDNIPDEDLTDFEKDKKDKLLEELAVLNAEVDALEAAFTAKRTLIRSETLEVLGGKDSSVLDLDTMNLILGGVKLTVDNPKEVNSIGVIGLKDLLETAWDLLKTAAESEEVNMDPSVFTANGQLMIEAIGQGLVTIKLVNTTADDSQKAEMENAKDILMDLMDEIAYKMTQNMVASQPPTTIETDAASVKTTAQYSEALNAEMTATGATIQLPGAEDIVGTGNDTTPSTSTVLLTLKQNPFSGNNSNSSDSSLSPASSLLSMDFFNASGQAMNLNNLNNAMMFFLTINDEVEPSVVNNYTTAADKKMVTHSMDVAANSALFISCSDWTPPRPENSTNDTETTTVEATTISLSTAGARRLLSLSDNTTDSSDNATGTAPVEKQNTTFIIYIGINRRPSVADHDHNCTVPREVEKGDGMPLDPNTCFISNAVLNMTTAFKVYWGVKETTPANKTNGTDSSGTIDDSSSSSSEVSETEYVPIPYQSSYYTASCVYWDPRSGTWASKGCSTFSRKVLADRVSEPYVRPAGNGRRHHKFEKVGGLTTQSKVQCYCTHISLPDAEDETTDDSSAGSSGVQKKSRGTAKKSWFGGGFSVPINTIDFANSAFTKLDENPAIFSTMVAIICFYFAMCIWARKADKVDELKAGTSPLPDNDPRDKYLYELLVYTGGRQAAGTTAKVSMILTGDLEETEPRLIDDPRRKVFERAGVDSFLMSVPRPLGDLALCRIWHDNSGKSPGWFFSRLQVTDLQTGEKSFFICDRWLAVEKDDGVIDRVVPLAGKEELTNFNHLFWSKTKKNLYDGHIWFSIFTRPRRSKFTRVQRLTCLLSLLFTTMLANIMFYKTGDDTSPNVYKLGPFSFTLEGLVTGIMASLIVFPINLLIVQFFRLSKEKPKKKITESTWRPPTADPAKELQNQIDFLETGDNNKRLLMSSTPVPSKVSFADQRPVTPPASAPASSEKKKKKCEIRFPWWFIFFAYALCFVTVITSGYFTVEFGGVFGAEKSEQWLSSFFVSLFESVFFTQPLKVLGLAIFYALVIKSPDVEDEEEEDPKLKKNEEYLHQNYTDNDLAAGLKPRRKALAPQPPDEEYLRAARVQRFKEMKMTAILREITVYVIFLYILMTVSYGFRDPWSNTFYLHTKEIFDSAAMQPNGVSLGDVSKRADIWNYVNDTLIPGIYGIDYYDGLPHKDLLDGYIADYATYRVGAPRLRQVRMRPANCMYPVNKYVEECRETYDMFDQDESAYRIGWIPLNTSDPTDKADDFWKYQDSDDTKGYPIFGRFNTYSGGGFVAEFGGNLDTARKTVKELFENKWIDRYTRAIFCEFVVWNPNLNLFAISSIAIEVPESGGVWPRYQMQILRLDRYFGQYMFVVLACEILLMCFVIFFLVKEIKKLKEEKRDYFKNFWNNIEFFTTVCMILAIVMYFYRLLIGNSTSNEFVENKFAFVNFQYVGYWDEMYGYLLGFINFTATLKSIKLLRFNKKMLMLGATLRTAGKPMVTFGVVFLTLFFAYAQLTYIIFGNQLINYASFITCCETLFAMMLGSFNFYEIDAVNPAFARVVFVSFMIMVTFIVVNLFLTLIMEAFARVKYDIASQKNEYEIVDFMIGKVKAMFGMGPKRDTYEPQQFTYQAGDDGTCDDLGKKIDSMIGKLEGYLDIKSGSKDMLRDVNGKPNKRKIMVS